MSKKEMLALRRFVIRHSSFVIRHSSFVIRHFPRTTMPAKITTPLCLLIVLALLAPMGCQPSSAPSDEVKCETRNDHGPLQFVPDAKTSCLLAKERGLPCLLFFTAEWSTYSQEMINTTCTNARVTELAERFVCVLVDADKEPELCQQYAISAYPTIQFLAADGRPLHQLVGQQNTRELVAGMQAATERLAWIEQDRTLRR